MIVNEVHFITHSKLKVIFFAINLNVKYMQEGEKIDTKSNKRESKNLKRRFRN